VAIKYGEIIADNVSKAGWSVSLLTEQISESKIASEKPVGVCMSGETLLN